MTLQLIEDAKGDLRNARFLALASDLAYLPESEGAPAYREQLGLEARLLSVGNTQAYVGTNDEHIVVAFRGTESPTSIEGLKDWLLSDAMNLLILPEGDLGTDYAAAGVDARFHQGFMKALADIWDPLFEAVDSKRKKTDRPLWLTGHSLGGALALLAGWRFKRKFVPVHQIYTFGGPMVGNDIAAKAIDRELSGRIFRYVNYPDPVPKLPTFSLIANHYCHCESEVSLGAAAESFAEVFKEKAGQTVDGLLNATLIEDIWKSLQARVNAHFMDNYRKLLEDLKQ
jgi:hypothetical protein